jgi:hypothetical protein
MRLMRCHSNGFCRKNVPDRRWSHTCPGDKLPKLMGHGVFRTTMQVQALVGKTEKICLNNPTALAAMAIGRLCMAHLEKIPLDKSFLDAGGIAAVVRLLKEPTCPIALRSTASIIETFCDWLLGLGEEHGLSPDPVDSLLEAGETDLAHMSTCIFIFSMCST